MSLIIWKPAQYVQEFVEEDITGDYMTPVNGETLAAPYDRDTVVREVPRFTGWKKECYCDTGEFEVTTADVKPEDVRRGNMVWLDGSVFVIEGYEWNLTENGHECTISGRDFWRYPESEIRLRYLGDPYRTLWDDDSGDYESNKFPVYNIASEIDGFLHDGYDRMAGWFRDRRRYPQGYDASEDLFHGRLTKCPDSIATNKTDGEPTVSEVMNYGAEWRMMASWLNVGIRFAFAFDEDAGVFTIQPEIYEGEDNNVELRADGRGVSSFRYSEDGRNAINAVLATWTSEKRIFEGVNHQYKGNAFTGATYANESAADYVNYFFYIAPNEHKSYAERLELFSQKHLDAGATPSESDGTKAKMMAWLRTNIEAEIVKPEQAFEFEYDNSGAYKYGVHFNVGDLLTVRDQYLGIAAKQRLVTVTTNYEAGSAKSYAFEFGEQTIKSAYLAKVQRKLSELSKRTGTARKAVE